jgi:hypothetical protein
LWIADRRLGLGGGFVLRRRVEWWRRVARCGFLWRVVAGGGFVVRHEVVCGQRV